MSPKTIAVVGATGGQGGSVVDSFLGAGYAVRAITRNASSPKASALKERGVEVVTADLNDLDSLVKAFEGVHIIFAVTDFSEPFSQHGPEKAMEIESTQGINLAKAATQIPSLDHYIWSTLPNALKISGGKYLIPHFQSKNQVDEFIKKDQNLVRKTTFLWVTWFASNNLFPPFKPTSHATSGKYILFQPSLPETPILSIGDHTKNVGPWALAIVKKPEFTLPGKFVLANTESTTSGALLETWGKVTGKETEFVKVGLEQYDRLFPGWGKEMGVMMEYWEKFPGLQAWSGQDVVVERDLGLERMSGIEEALRGLELL